MLSHVLFLYYDCAVNVSLHLQREGFLRYTNRGGPRKTSKSTQNWKSGQNAGLYMLDYRTCPSACLFIFTVFFSQHDY